MRRIVGLLVIWGIGGVFGCTTPATQQPRGGETDPFFGAGAPAPAAPHSVAGGVYIPPIDVRTPPAAGTPVSTLPPGTHSPSMAALASAKNDTGRATYLGIDDVAPAHWAAPEQTNSIQPIKVTRASAPVAAYAKGKEDANSEDQGPLNQVQEQLKAHGVTWQQLECVDGVWHFRCTVAHPDDPRLGRYYEARAADQLSAVRAVLERLEPVPP